MNDVGEFLEVRGVIIRFEFDRLARLLREHEMNLDIAGSAQRAQRAVRI